MSHAPKLRPACACLKMFGNIKGGPGDDGMSLPPTDRVGSHSLKMPLMSSIQHKLNINK